MLGQTIKELRKQKNLNQVELAEKVGITQTSLSSIESGRTQPSKNTLAKISEALETPLPIIFMMSVKPEEIPEKKREAFTKIQPLVKTLLQDAFKEE